jgi:hypothetical protein
LGIRQTGGLLSIILGKERYLERGFVECQIKDKKWQKVILSSSLPTAQHMAKISLRQTNILPSVRHSAKSDTWQRGDSVRGCHLPLIFAKCCYFTLGKEDFTEFQN